MCLHCSSCYLCLKAHHNNIVIILLHTIIMLWSTVRCNPHTVSCYRIHKMEVEDDLPLPLLSEDSELMDPFHIQQVNNAVPPS